MVRFRQDERIFVRNRAEAMLGSRCMVAVCPNPTDIPLHPWMSVESAGFLFNRGSVPFHKYCVETIETMSIIHPSSGFQLSHFFMHVGMDQWFSILFSVLYIICYHHHFLALSHPITTAYLKRPLAMFFGYGVLCLSKPCTPFLYRGWFLSEYLLPKCLQL